MIRKFARALQELIYPRCCLLCHKKILPADFNELVCSQCLETITLNTPPFCQKCGRKIKGKLTARNICSECRQRHYDFDRAWASCAYEGNLKEMLHCFKYKNKTALKEPLSNLIIEFAQRYLLPINYCDYIIPMPLSSRRLREREFNQAEALTDKVAKHFKLQILKSNLLRIKDTPSQTGLDKETRLFNVRGAFSVKTPEVIRGKAILVVDDVLTTGATASEAARTLKDAGAGVVFVLTLAN